MINLILMLAFAMALAIFAVQNTAPVQVHFLVWRFMNVPMSILAISSSFLGIILAFLLSLPTHSHRKKQLKQKEKELSQLRDALGKH